jgi:hypothetical protein
MFRPSTDITVPSTNTTIATVPMKTRSCACSRRAPYERAVLAHVGGELEDRKTRNTRKGARPSAPAAQEEEREVSRQDREQVDDAEEASSAPASGRRRAASGIRR